MDKDELVAQADNGMAIYRYYMQRYTSKTLRLGQSYFTPFRDERHPSFNLFRSTQDGRGFIYWKDQASIGGSVWDFVMRIERCDFKTAIELVRVNVLGLPARPDRIEKMRQQYLPPLPVKVKQADVEPIRPIITPQVREIPFYTGPYAAVDEKYFPQHIFGEKLLADFGCRPLDSYHFYKDDPDEPKPKDFRVYARPTDPLYHYDFGEGMRHKIVRPYAPPPKPGKKKMKWIGTTRTELDLFGWARVQRMFAKFGKMPAGILLAGNRDTMAGARLTKLPTLAVTAEGHVPTEAQVQQMFEVCDNWWVLYDLDDTGIYFQRVLTDQADTEQWQDWHRKELEKGRPSRRFGFRTGLDTLLHHFQQNDLTALLESRPVYEHQRLGTWLRQAVGLSH